MPVDANRFYRWTAIVGAVTLFSTRAACFLLTRIHHVYVGGLLLPYFSDMGRDPPAYFVFVVGLSVVAVALSILWQFHGARQREALDKTTECRHRRAAKAAMVLGATSPICLPILAVCGTSVFPWTHSISAALFFLLQTVAVVINTVVTYHIYAMAKKVHGSLPSTASDKLTSCKNHVIRIRYALLVQTALCTLLALALILYLPVGLSIADKYTRLTIAQCLRHRLGETYCTQTVRLDSSRTTLWAYENDLIANQFRALMELVCNVTLTCYVASFVTHDYSSEDVAPSRPTVLVRDGIGSRSLSLEFEALDATRTSSACSADDVV